MVVSQTLSYNGEMRFTVEIPSHAKEGFSDFEPLTTPVPLVSLLGNFVLRLNYIPPVGEIAELRSERTFVVKFREVSNQCPSVCSIGFV